MFLAIPFTQRVTQIWPVLIKIIQFWPKNKAQKWPKWKRIRSPCLSASAKWWRIPRSSSQPEICDQRDWIGRFFLAIGQLFGPSKLIFRVRGDFLRIRILWLLEWSKASTKVPHFRPFFSKLGDFFLVTLICDWTSEGRVLISQERWISVIYSIKEKRQMKRRVCKWKLFFCVRLEILQTASAVVWTSLDLYKHEFQYL